jgi:hypothetical protein
MRKTIFNQVKRLEGADFLTEERFGGGQSEG